ncbi:MAG TPA: MFS transporter [Pseudolabrys sp.]|jgi:MFS family permease
MTSSARNAQLAILTLAFALSQAFRTIPSITVNGIAEEMQSGPAALALFAGVFHWSFALMQVPVGLALDIFGVRRTVIALSGFAVAGGAICALAPDMNSLFLGQILIGIGCSPAFMAAIVFTARHWPVARFAGISGLVLALGTGGMLLSATPLAWFIDRWSWRAGFAILAAMSLLTLFTSVLALEKSAMIRSRKLAAEILAAFYGLRFVLFGRRPLALLAIGFVSYGAVITIRGLWIVPMFVERYTMTLLAAGNVALLFSISMILGPALAGHFDPGDKPRPAAIAAMAILMSAAIGVLALFDGYSLWLDIILCTFLGLMSGFFILVYAEARSSYPAELTGRGLTALNMSMFLGAAVAQSLSGVIAAAAQKTGWNGIDAVLLFLSASLFAGTFCFFVLIRSAKPVAA